MSAVLSREVPIDLAHAALLLIDVQNYTSKREGGEYAGLDAAEMEARHGYFFRTLDSVALPNMRRVLETCRRAGIEVLYTVIENRTRDGRDASLDYKISRMLVPKGSWDAQVLEDVAPLEDEIVISKTSSSVFVSTNIDYVLRNLGIRSLMVVGMLTDQCVDSAVRDACDLGYLVTVVTDACVTKSQERHDSALRNNAGYARQVTMTEIVTEIERLSAAAR
jgi:ureidoacrylate peracid hydrolase